MFIAIKKWSALLLLTICLGYNAQAQKKKHKSSESGKTVTVSGQQDRVFWSDMLYKMASPVVLNLASGTLKKNMPLEKAPNYGLKAEQVTYLEAVGRTMA